MALVGGEFVEARGLTLVFRQTDTAVLVTEAELGLRPSVSLVSGKFVEARGLTLVFRQTDTAVLVTEAELVLRPTRSPLSGRSERLVRSVRLRFIAAFRAPKSLAPKAPVGLASFCPSSQFFT